MPFVTWLLMGYFESIPEELEEAAMIDGATRFGAFWRIMLPLAAPGVLARGALRLHPGLERVPLLAGLHHRRSQLRTLPVGLASFITGDVYGWGYLMAGAVLTTLAGHRRLHLSPEVHGGGPHRAGASRASRVRRRG